MRSRDSQIRRRIKRIEDKLFPYLNRTGIECEELLDYMWLSNPESFRKQAENCTHMRAVMERPPRRDREQFLRWVETVIEPRVVVWEKERESQRSCR